MEGLNWNYVLAYIEDIISITKGDYENHFEVLQQVLERLHKYRLRLRRDKCSFVCKEVEYQVSTVGIAPQYEYLDRIRAWPKPKSRDAFRPYLCLFPFLSMFLLVPLQSFVHSSMDKNYFTLTTRLPLKFTLMYKPGKLMIFPDAWSRVPATVADIVKTVTQEEGRLFSEEAHIALGNLNGYTETLSTMKDVFWKSRHYDIRSWISKWGCSFAKDGRRRRKIGIHNPLD